MESHNDETRVCDGMSFLGPAHIGRMLQDLVRLAETPDGRTQAIAFIANHPNYKRALSHLGETKAAILKRYQDEETRKALNFLVGLIGKALDDMTARDLVYLTWFFDGPQYRNVWDGERPKR